MEYYTQKANKRREKFKKKLSPKDLTEGQLVLRYDNKFNHRKDGKFLQRWEGPFQIMRRFDNGSYHLQDMRGKVHATRVNGWCLKPYFPGIEIPIIEELSPLESSDQPQSNALG